MIFLVQDSFLQKDKEDKEKSCRENGPSELSIPGSQAFFLRLEREAGPLAHRTLFLTHKEVVFQQQAGTRGQYCPVFETFSLTQAGHHITQ